MQDSAKAVLKVLRQLECLERASKAAPKLSKARPHALQSGLKTALLHGGLLQMPRFQWPAADSHKTTPVL